MRVAKKCGLALTGQEKTINIPYNDVMKCNFVTYVVSMVSIVLIPAIGALGCKRAVAGQPATSSQVQSAETPVRVRSVIVLLADPERFHGQEVTVQAFVSRDHSQFVLAADLSSLTQSLAANTVYLDVTKAKYVDQLFEVDSPAKCVVSGIVDAADRGPMPFSMMACTLRATKLSLVAPLRK